VAKRSLRRSAALRGEPEGLIQLDVVVRAPDPGFVTAAIVVPGEPGSGLERQSAKTSRLSWMKNVWSWPLFGSAAL
jgi:hypothetical protein